ncbi:MAG TPA: 5'/3'-nucleotidase SurE [Flavobacteriales bacterium]|nr:5'/3'-nucleotidase SurE [Flavobacteriales bacterium]HRJ34786.1 5'/3'-nucleotidase SurE [Flavobacteriales bacterium]HRJ37989.1 5'/3'-nucleotidase SurE [Flavobacteriales bacterium]
MKKKKPVILVTNDDGITAPGIRALVEAVKGFGTILIVSPDSPQSGMGHAITVNEPLRLYPSKEYGKLESYACSGTPVDCVKLGIYEILKYSPDLIVSGINHGSNVSTNVLYSGTMSAAVEGALEGIPSIGFSLTDYSMTADFSAAQKVVKSIVKEVLEKGMPEGICFNVNIPKLPYSKIKGVKVCRQAHAFWEDKFDNRKDPLGKPYYWLTGEFKSYDGGKDTDLWALENNYVSLVPVQYDMTAHQVLGKLNYSF